MRVAFGSSLFAPDSRGRHPVPQRLCHSGYRRRARAGVMRVTCVPVNPGTLILYRNRDWVLLPVGTDNVWGLLTGPGAGTIEVHGTPPMSCATTSPWSLPVLYTLCPPYLFGQWIGASEFVAHTLSRLTRGSAQAFAQAGELNSTLARQERR